MKQIFDNKYLRSFKFTSSQEALTFLNNQETKKILTLDETIGGSHYFYVFYHALTQKTLFVLGFESDEKEDRLNLLFWEKSQLLVLDTGKTIHLIDSTPKALGSFEITSPLVGLYLTSGNNVLILEEASLRLINSSGEVLQSELFDLIKDFTVDSDFLSLEIDGEEKVFRLS